MLQDPQFWVCVAFIAFVALVYKKAFLFSTKALDSRSAKIKEELDQARTLREEAETVLADYKRKQAEYLKEAEEMIARARDDANTFRAQAEKQLKSDMEIRTKQAIDKIAREENQAIQDVRNHVVDIALSAARAVIIDHVGNLSQDELVKLAIADIERKIH